MRLGEVAAATGGRLHHADADRVVTGPVEFDSRRAAPGGLFVAFPGARVDGHDFAVGAVAAGAVAVLGTRPLPGVPMVLVDDPLAAMGRLARAVLDRLPELTVVGVTGSSGKTTTKDLLGQVLGRLGPTVAPAGSFNNELGLPHTVLKVDPDTRFLVLELGARGVGHIRYLCEIAPPTVAVVVNVGVAHLGEFGSVEAIARAKGELVEAVPPTGFVVLNADDPLVRGMSTRTGAEVLLAGESPDAHLRADGVGLDERGRASFTMVGPDGAAVAVRLGVCGRHQVGNALLVAAVAVRLGLDMSEAARCLGDARLISSRRMDVFDRADGVTVIDDSYNANPASVAAALRALAAMAPGRRRVAVLGYLAELGEYERAGHEEVGRLAAELGVDLLVAVGDEAAPVAHGAAGAGAWGGKSVQVTDQATAIEVLRHELRAGDVVLVKGSRYRTWEVADALRADDPARQHAGAAAARCGSGAEGARSGSGAEGARSGSGAEGARSGSGAEGAR